MAEVEEGVRVSTPGTVSASARRPGNPAGGPQTSTLAAIGGKATFTFDLGDTGPMIVRVSHQSTDGTVTLSEVRQAGETTTATTLPRPAPSTTVAPATERLGPDSRLRIDGIGPVQVGMTIEEARRAAGVELTVSRGSEPCTGAGAVPLPGALFIVTSHDGPRIDLIKVSGPGVSTLSGIHVGSTEAEVLAAYPGRIEPRTGLYLNRELAYRAADPTLKDLELVFDITDNRVTTIRTGRVATLALKEPCG